MPSDSPQHSAQRLPIKERLTASAPKQNLPAALTLRRSGHAIRVLADLTHGGRGKIVNRKCYTFRFSLRSQSAQTVVVIHERKDKKKVRKHKEEKKVIKRNNFYSRPSERRKNKAKSARRGLNSADCCCASLSPSPETHLKK
jgi:hypothetical protein